MTRLLRPWALASKAAWSFVHPEAPNSEPPKFPYKDVYEAHHMLVQGKITKDEYRKYLKSGESIW